MKLQQAEIEALHNSGRLLHFVAEHRQKTALTQDLVSKITRAWELSESNQWNPAAATEFWLAYSDLCDIAQPTTIDTIKMNSPVVAGEKDAHKLQAGGLPTGGAAGGEGIGPAPAGQEHMPVVAQNDHATSDNVKPRSGWLPRSFWPKGRTRSRQFAGACMALLLVLLALVVLFGYIVSSADALSREIRELIAHADGVAPQIRADIGSIASDLAKLALDDKTRGTLDPSKSALDQNIIETTFPAEVSLKIMQLRERLQILYHDTDTMYQKIQAISRVMPFVPTMADYDKGELSPVPTLRDATSNLTAYFVNRRNVNERLQSAWTWITMYNGFVPMLLGALGASTYVVRLISEEIRATTFSRTSPIRHVMRIALGALAGVIIGFGGIVTGTGLSSAALAFIAGYAVEPVFSTLDGIAEKFRTSREDAAVGK